MKFNPTLRGFISFRVCFCAWICITESWSLSNKTAPGTANCKSLRIEELSWNKFHKESKLQNFALYLILSRPYTFGQESYLTIRYKDIYTIRKWYNKQLEIYSILIQEYWFKKKKENTRKVGIFLWYILLIEFKNYPYHL